jgi:hypothetical protein
MATHATENFDWVTAQSACSAAAMFAKLLDGVRGDVERRNALLQGAESWQFELLADDEGRFEVSRTGPGSFSSRSAVVVFERVGPRINIAGDGVEVDLVAVVGLSAAGECRYFVGEAEYLGWEVRKMALDVLFFEAGDEDE